jgi:hypothetical protein
MRGHGAGHFFFIENRQAFKGVLAVRRLFRSLPFSCIFFVAMLTASSGWAIKEYKSQFEAKYLKSGGSDMQNGALKKSFEKTPCAVCHVGEKKKQLNAYGQAFRKAFDRKAGKRNAENIQAAFEKVESQRSRPGDPESPTFGEVLKQGKMPAGDKR